MRQTFRLLIADDEPGIRNGIATLFPWSELGIEVVAACGNGLEVLDFMGSNPVDFLLCDIRMPKMDGLRLVEAVREKAYPCEIVLISAYKDFEYARKAIQLGVRRFIVKPTGYEELREIFSALVGERLAAGREEGKGEGSAGSSTSEAPLGLVGRVGALIARDLSNAKLSCIARELGMSPNYFSSVFHRETGETFSEFLSTARMERAKSLLENGQHKVYEIGRMVGYASVKSFIRAFHERYGSPPSAFRRNRENEGGTRN